MRRRSVPLLAAAVALAGTGLSAAPQAKKYTLQELLDMARAAYPGLQANAAATSASEELATEAWRNWLPQGTLQSVLAPSPEIHCQVPPGVNANIPGVFATNVTDECVYTSSPVVSITSVNWFRPFTRTELNLVQPIWDFGKISAAVRAADAGVGISREKQAGAAADLDLNVRKAYWGYKLAREILDTLDEGSGYVDDGQKRIDKDLANGTGNVSVTDRLRLRTVRADLDARILEAKKLQGLARDSLRTLLGAQAPADLDIDDEPLVPVDVTTHPVTYYEDLARANRPEVRALDYAVKAKQALADLEKRKIYPDLVLVGSGAFAHAGPVDDPHNAFVNHYFNSPITAFGVAAALRMQLDLGPKLSRAARTRAEATEIEYRRGEALGGILLEVRKAYGELTEAAARVTALQKGEKAGKSWISAVSQNFVVGVAEARDLTDALIAFFAMRTRYLQAVYDLNIATSALARATGSSSL
jgi:outer membrane protein TolC